MRKNLTRGEILGNKCEIAELFAKPGKPQRRRSAPVNTAVKVAVLKQALGAEIGSQCSTAQPDAQLETWQAFLQALAQVPCHLSGDVQRAGLKLLFVAKRNAEQAEKYLFRVFISSAKRLGNAVQRNRAKRLQREFYRHSKAELRRITQQALKAAAKQFLRRLPADISGSAAKVEQLCTVCRSVEQEFFYHWGLVIYRNVGVAECEGAEIRIASINSNSATSTVIQRKDGREWQGQWQKLWGNQALNSAFLSELQRYQFLLDQLGRNMQKKWFEHFQQTWELVLPLGQAAWTGAAQQNMSGTVEQRDCK